MEEREFDIYEVKSALVQAANHIEAFSSVLDLVLKFARSEDPFHHDISLQLLEYIKAENSAIKRRLRQADEFLDSPLDAQNINLMEDVDVMTKLSAIREDTKALWKETERRNLEIEKPNHH